MTDELLTRTQACGEYHISNDRMNKLLKSGTIPYLESPLDGRVKLIQRSDIDAWASSVAWAPMPTRRKKVGA